MLYSVDSILYGFNLLDTVSIKGTVFLWCFWPSFNGALATGDERLRAIVNTYMSLMACVVVTMAISSVLDKKGRIEMVSVLFLTVLIQLRLKWF